MNSDDKTFLIFLGMFCLVVLAVIAAMAHGEHRKSVVAEECVKSGGEWTMHDECERADAE